MADMFRQILVESRNADFRILWRLNPESPLQHYRLRTVTYGLIPAPYLAMRVLQQLAIDDGHLFPAAVPIIESSIYVDDTLFGQDSLHELRETRDRLIGLMKGEGFQLRKWAANSPILLEDTPASQHELDDHFLAKDETLKILGLSWLPQEDVFCFVIASSVTVSPTRHSILSFVAKLYDPLGWAAPVVIIAKILLQELWLLKNDWDAPIQQELVRRWKDCNGAWTTSRIWHMFVSRAGPARARRVYHWKCTALLMRQAAPMSPLYI
jgi:hypothetical protein